MGHGTVCAVGNGHGWQQRSTMWWRFGSYKVLRNRVMLGSAMCKCGFVRWVCKRWRNRGAMVMGSENCEVSGFA